MHRAKLLSLLLVLCGSAAFAETTVLPAAGKALAMVESDEPGSQWSVFAIDFVKQQIAAVTPHTFDDGKKSRCLIEGTPGSQCGVTRFDKDGKQREQLVIVLGGATPIVPPPPPDPIVTPPPPPPPVTATAVTFFYEKDKHAVPSPILAGLNKLNRERKILATLHEIDATDGTGDVPDQYRVSVVAAKKSAGVDDEGRLKVPVLVVTAGGVVLKTVNDPRTIEQVMEAAL